ncbi:MAG: flagellar basal body protein [Burkholderiaceae bacterium]
MNTLASIALSGLQAAQQRMGASAHNIANAQTPGFHRQLVQQQASPDGGVATQLAGSPLEGDSLAEDIVAMKSAALEFKANLRVLRTQDQLLGSLLDEVA